MDVLVQRYYNEALAPATKRTYASAQSRYCNFCSAMNIPPLPVTQTVLCRFVAYLAQSIVHKTIKSYLSAIRHLQITRMGTDPRICEMAVLSYVMQGIKRRQACSGLATQRPRLPVTVGIMRELKLAWEAQGVSFKTTMLWAAACTCFFGFLRSGEATVPTTSSYDPEIHLSITDISIDSLTSPNAIMVRIVKASKTDSLRQGVTLYLGRTGVDLCPVSAFLSYITRRGMAPGPLFKFENGLPLTRNALVCELRSALQSRGFNPEPFSGHSFRIGAATSAAAAGIEDAVIKILGRWQSTAYLQYVRLPRSDLADISARLANQ